jgi:hypothetical protein
MVVIEAPAFTRHLSDYMGPEDYRAFQTALCEQPATGDLMPRCGGFRKVRWSDPRRNKGTRGGLRVIYYYFEAEQQLWLLTVYDKNEQDGLTKQQERILKTMLEGELAARRIAREKR